MINNLPNVVFLEREERTCEACHRGTPRVGVEVYLCGPAHTPCDGSAHHFCEDHLDAGAEKCDLEALWENIRLPRR